MPDEQLTIRSEYLPFGKPSFSEEEIAAVSQVIRSGWVGMGPETIAFEQELASYMGTPHIVTVNSCTSALFLALHVKGVGPNDEVICPSLTWCSTANASLYLGATPVFCDVDPRTYCATAETVRASLTPRTKAVVVVHMGGWAADVAAIRRILPAGVALIEDAAHALGARYPDGSAVGTSGNLCCFSFYANKNLATGEGGAIAIPDEETANAVKSLRLHSLPIDAWKRFTNPKTILRSEGLSTLGYKMNYTDLQACIGRVQLRRQPEFQQIRMSIARAYSASLDEESTGFRFQDYLCHDSHARHLVLVEVPIERLSCSRDEMIVLLRERNIGASVHYAPLHKMPLYNHPSDVILPHTDRICERVTTLPISASMSVDDAEYVTKSLKAILASCTREHDS